MLLHQTETDAEKLSKDVYFTSQVSSTDSINVVKVVCLNRLVSHDFVRQVFVRAGSADLVCYN